MDIIITFLSRECLETLEQTPLDLFSSPSSLSCNFGEKERHRSGSNAFVGNFFSSLLPSSRGLFPFGPDSCNERHLRHTHIHTHTGPASGVFRDNSATGRRGGLLVPTRTKPSARARGCWVVGGTSAPLVMWGCCASRCGERTAVREQQVLLRVCCIHFAKC